MSSYGSLLSTFGTITQAVGQIKAATDAAAVGRYNARAAEATAQREAIAAEIEATQQERLATIAEQDITLARQAQTYREARLRDQQERLLDTSRAIVAASGLMLDGSPLAVYEETLRQSELDILATRYETALRVRASGEDATQRRYAAEVLRYGGVERLRVGGVQGSLLRAQADEVLTGGLLSATGTLASGVGEYLYLREREASIKAGAVNPGLLGRK